MHKKKEEKKRKRKRKPAKEQTEKKTEKEKKSAVRAPPTPSYHRLRHKLFCHQRSIDFIVSVNDNKVVSQALVFAVTSPYQYGCHLKQWHGQSAGEKFAAN